MAVSTSFNLPQFDDAYDGLKMRQLVDELMRTHAEFTRTFDWILSNQETLQWADDAGQEQPFIALDDSVSAGTEVGHVVVKSFASQQTTSGTYVDKTGATIAHASLDDNEDYLVYVRATHFNATSQSTNSNGIRVTYNNVVVNGGEKLWEGVIGITDTQGQEYSWCGIVSSGTAGDIQLEFKSGNASDTIDVGFATLMAIKVSDLTLNTNIFHDEDVSVIELDDGNFPPTNYEELGASLTIGDDTSDYLVFGCVWIGDWLTGGNTVDWRVRESAGNTVKVAGMYQRADNSDEVPRAFIQLYKAQAATTLTIEATCTGNPVDAKRSFLAAIRLNAFSEYFTDYDADPDESGWGFPQTKDLVTIAETAAVTSANWGFIAAATDTYAGSSLGESTYLALDIDGAGDITVGGDETWKYLANGTSHRQTRFMVSADQAISAGETIAADLKYKTPTSANTAGVTEALIVGFTWELTQLEEWLVVGNPNFRTHYLGSQHRFFGSDGVDYVQFEHDDTDFNISGFQTADLNILDLRLVTDASATDQAGFNIPTGVAPTSPVQGDIWVTATDILARLNSVNESLLFVDFKHAIGDLDDALDFFVGTALDLPDIAVTSNGTIITLSLEQDGGGDVRFVFTDGIHTHDCTPADTIALTVGTDTVPVLNYVYILQSTKAITISTSDWPAAEHARLGTVLCQSAASLQTDGAYKVHAWTDESFDSGSTSHIADVNFWIRHQAATWLSGTLCTPTAGVATFDLAVASGSLLQLHPQAFPAFDTSTGSEVMVVNDFTTAFKRVGDLTGELTDANSISMSTKYYNIVVWGVVSQDSGDCQLMVNLPTASYNNSANASLDPDATAVYDIPADFLGTGFLIARLTMRHQAAAGGTFTLVQNADLRGRQPSTSAGGSTGGGVSELIELTDVDTAAQTANLVLATPDGSTGNYLGRALVQADLPGPVTATTAELEDITDAINTDVLKVFGFQVFNTTTSIPYWAAGAADGDVWTDATGATIHTPV